MKCQCGNDLDKRGRNQTGRCRSCNGRSLMLAKPKPAAHWDRMRRIRTAWIPDGYGDAYRHLLMNKRIPAADAKAIVLADYEAKRPNP